MCARLNPKLRQRDPDLVIRGPAVQYGDRAPTVSRELARPDVDVAFAADSPSLRAAGVLIHSHDLRRREDRAHLVGHRAQIVASHKRCREHRPHREMRAALGDGQISVANFEHVRVVPVIRPGESMQVGLAIEDRQNARPLGLDVPAGAPEMPDLAGPLPWARTSPLADRKHDDPPRGAAPDGPLGIQGARTHALSVAPNDLEGVSTPLRETTPLHETTT